jgi:hypothetical protein
MYRRHIVSDEAFVRHHLPIILDVPERLAADPVRLADVLNLVCLRLTEGLERDERLQALLRRHGIEWGWEQGTWERTQP